MTLIKSLIVGWVIWRALMSFYYQEQVRRLNYITKSLFKLGGIDIDGNNNSKKANKATK